MAIGFHKKKRGLFGSSQPSMGDMTAGAAMQSPFMQQQAPAMETPKRGTGTKHIVGIIGDALLGSTGRQGIYGPMLARQKAQDEHYQRQQQMAQQSRQWGMEDFKAEHDYKVANPTPQKPPALLQTFKAFQGLPGDEQKQLLQFQDMINPLGEYGADGQYYPRLRVPTPPVSHDELPEGYTIRGGTAGNSGGSFQR